MNSSVLRLGTKLDVKIKGAKCELSKEDLDQIILGNSLFIVAFDNISRWSIGGQEGINATNIRLLSMDQEQLMNFLNGGK